MNNEKELEGLAKDFKLEIADHTGLDYAFFTYQEGKMSKRKLCELIGDWMAEVHMKKIKGYVKLPKEGRPEKLVKIIRENYFYTDKYGVGRQTPLDEYAKEVAKEILIYLKGENK